jgi:uncharacterized protein YbaP (TraB family)
MSNQIKNRAETPEQKADVLKRVLDCWANQLPSMRLGQMLLNLVEKEHQLWLIEDETLTQRLEEWAEKIKKLDQKI